MVELGETGGAGRHAHRLVAVHHAVGVSGGDMIGTGFRGFYWGVKLKFSGRN